MSATPKFGDEDLPKILAALETARTAGSKALVEVRFDANGGVTSIDIEYKKKIK